MKSSALQVAMVAEVWLTDSSVDVPDAVKRTSEYEQHGTVRVHKYIKRERHPHDST